MEVDINTKFNETLPVDIPDEYLILGECSGVALLPRGSEDDHICFIILSEDDGHWFQSHSGWSSYWLEDVRKQMERAEAWCKVNAEPDIHRNGGQYGYKFKNYKRKICDECGKPARICLAKMETVHGNINICATCWNKDYYISCHHCGELFDKRRRPEGATSCEDNCKEKQEAKIKAYVDDVMRKFEEKRKNK